MRKLSWLTFVVILLLGCSNVATVVETKEIERDDKNIPFAKLLDEEVDQKKTAQVKEESPNQARKEKKQASKQKEEEGTVSYKKNKKYTFKVKDGDQAPYLMTYAGADSYFEDADSWQFREPHYIRWIIREDKKSMTELMGESDYLVGLPYPLEIGNTFETMEGISEITDLNLEITIQAGRFDRVVEMSGGGVRTYFAPDAGRILTVDSDEEIYYELLEMTKR